MITPMSRYEALQLAILRAGTQDALAALLSVTQPTISNWVTRSKQLPAEHVLTVEAAYGVSRHDLRPDIYPRDLMIDQTAEERFCGIDLRRADRREAPRRKVA